MKVALFGGSFDPVHTDHINIIETCKNKLGFDEVWVVPAYVNPFKHKSLSSVTQRLEMLEIATRHLDYIHISDYEISKVEQSYTYNTVLHFINKYPEHEFSFIMGSDQLDRFEEWNHFPELINTITFKVFLRTNDYNHDVIDKYNLETFEFDNNHLSSTKIRNLEELDKQIPEINDYINNNLLYLHERLELNMDKARYEHSLNVGKMAMELAAVNEWDLNEARIAGTLHDVVKRWPREKMVEYINKYQPDLINEPEAVWHSYVGAFHLKYDWLFKNDKIITAVFKHTVGSKDMNILDLIVFCSDKISAERDYPGVEDYRTIVKHDLIAGFKKLLINQYDVAVEKHGKDSIGEGLIETYDHWIKE